MKIKIKRGDEVVVIAGKDKGKTGKVIRVLPLRNKVIVSGVNLVRKHLKPSKSNEGGIVSQEMPIHVSNVSYVHADGISTKVGFRFLDDGKKVRFAKASGEVIG
jgi:large subunit ribosomal protein L24